MDIYMNRNPCIFQLTLKQKVLDFLNYQQARQRIVLQVMNLQVLLSGEAS